MVSRLGGRLVTDAELAALFADPDTGYVDTVSIDDGVNLVLPASIGPPQVRVTG